MALVAGVDAYRKGWVAVVLLDGVVEQVAIFDSCADILEALPDADADRHRHPDRHARCRRAARIVEPDVSSNPELRWQMPTIRNER